MRLQIFPALCFAGILQVHSIKAAPGAENAVAIPASVSVEEIPDLLSKVDNTLRVSEDALLGVLESAAAQQRVPHEALERLRTSFQSPVLTSWDADLALANAELPKGNEKVERAVDAFLEACDIAEAQRGQLARNAMEQIAQKTTDLTRNAKSGDELSSCISIVQQLAYALGSQTVYHKQGYSCGAELSRCSSYLVVLKALMWNSAQRSPIFSFGPERENAVARDLPEAEIWGRQAREFVSPKDVRARLVPLLAPFRNEATEARELLEAALFGKKAAEEASQALAQYESSQRRLEQLSRPLSQDRGIGFGVNSLPYRSFIAGLKALEGKDFLSARRAAGNALREIWGRGAENSEKLQALAVEWERENPDPRDIELRDLRALISARLSQANDAADLEGLAMELEAKIKAAPGYHYRLIGEPVQRTIEAAAKSLSVDKSGGSLQMDVSSKDGVRFASEWAEFKSRILRKELASALDSPELNERPYSREPLFESLDSLCESLAVQKDWRRLVRVLEGMSNLSWSVPLLPGRKEAISSLKTYLRGRNFESAELWKEAAVAYKSVLRDSARWPGAEETVLRLKKLSEEHPAEVMAAQLPPRPEHDITE